MADGCTPVSTPPPPPPAKVDTAVPQTTALVRRLIPLAAFFIAFCTVMTLLLVYMDSAALRHQQFRANMSRDYDVSVAQDDPQLAAYIREVLLRPAADPHHTQVAHGGETEVGEAVVDIVDGKKEGVFLETAAYRHNRPSDTEWLERNYSWSGLLVQPDPRDYFNLRKHGRGRSQSIHACISPTNYPKEVTYHQDERDGVKINLVHANSLIDDDWFNTRVKCFPLFSLLLAINCTTVDFLSLDTEGTELAVLETVPFDKVSIEVINVHITDDEDTNEGIRKFLTDKGNTIRNGHELKIFAVVEEYQASINEAFGRM